MSSSLYQAGMYLLPISYGGNAVIMLAGNRGVRAYRVFGRLDAYHIMYWGGNQNE